MDMYFTILKKKWWGIPFSEQEVLTLQSTQVNLVIHPNSNQDLARLVYRSRPDHLKVLSSGEENVQLNSPNGRPLSVRFMTLPEDREGEMHTNEVIFYSQNM
jgi:hypothetical protein